MAYNAMFPRNPQPETFAELMELFKDTKNIHRFIKAQMVAGAKFALVWVRIHSPKLDIDKVAEGLMLSDMKKRKVKLDKHIDAMTGPAEKMIDKLLESDKRFFKDYRYDEETNQMQVRKCGVDKYL